MIMTLAHLTISGPGWFLVSPSEGWCLIKCESSLVGGGENRLQESIDYGEKVDGFLVPKHVQVQYGPKPLKDRSASLYSRDECDFSELHRLPDQVDRDFTLMAYGLPDVRTQKTPINTLLPGYSDRPSFRF